MFPCSFNKSLWKIYVNVSTVWWFSFGVHALVREILRTWFSVSFSLFLKWAFSFAFLMNVSM